MPPELSSEPTEFTVEGHKLSMRLDAYLAARYPKFSRSVIQKIIDAGAVAVNDQSAKASLKVRPGDRIRIRLPDIGNGSPQPEDIPLRIVHEDASFVVIDKAPGMVVHPARGNWRGTVVNALQYHFENLSTVGGAERPGIVHRLDRDTSGLLLVAKDDFAHKALALQFEHRTVEKEYRALVYGVPDRDSDYIDAPIRVHPTVREKMWIPREHYHGGREAVTFYEVLERFRHHAYVRCKPETGRTHQIRVHLTHIGYPIVADKLYSGRSQFTLGELDPRAADPDRVLIDRQALHAHRLKIAHPTTEQPLEFVAPLPEDMAGVLAALRASRQV